MIFLMRMNTIYFFRVLDDANAMLFDFYNWESAVYIFDSGLDGRTLDPLIINSDTFGVQFTDLIEIKSDDTIDDIIDRLPNDEDPTSKIFLINVEEDLV